MVDKLKQKIGNFNKAAGVEILVQQDASVQYNLTIAEKIKNTIRPVFSQKKITSAEELIKLIPTGCPVSIAYSGKGLILKKLSRKAFSEMHSFSEILPNVKEEDLMISEIETGENVYLTLIRRSTILQQIQHLRNLTAEVVHADSAPGVLNTICGILPDCTFNTDFYKISVTDTIVKEISQITEGSPTIVTIGNEQKDSFLIVSFAAAIVLLSPGAAEGKIPETTLYLTEAREKIFFTKAGWTALISLAVLVMLNLVFFFLLNGQNRKLSEQNTDILSQVQELELSEKKLDEKEGFMKKAGWLNSSRIAFYMDDIASTVPISVRLTEININPFDDVLSREQKKIVFQTGKVLITGSCKDPVVLNPWIKTLKARTWVSNVSNRKYWFDHKNKMGNFEIEMVIGDAL